MSDSYADSVVTGAEQDSGGLVGKAQGATITRSYAVGVVADTGTHVGGLVGRIEDMPAYVTTVVNSFYDTATTGQTASAGGTGKTTSEMQQQATFTGWDFSSIWAINPAINGGYPYLRAIALQ